MCGSNSETKVCRSRIDNLRDDGTHIVFGAGCSKAQWQHIIRHQLTPRECIDPPDWDLLAASMGLVRSDGRPWSASWDRIVIGRVQTSMARKAREAEAKGLIWRRNGRKAWHKWTRGFLSPEWDGVDFSEAGAKRLLASTERQSAGLAKAEDEIAMLQEQLQSLGQPPVVPPRCQSPRPVPRPSSRRSSRSGSDQDSEVEAGDSLSRVGQQPGNCYQLPPRPTRPPPRAPQQQPLGYPRVSLFRPPTPLRPPPPAPQQQPLFRLPTAPRHIPFRPPSPQPGPLSLPARPPPLGSSGSGACPPSPQSGPVENPPRPSSMHSQTDDQYWDRVPLGTLAAQLRRTAAKLADIKYGVFIFEMEKQALRACGAGAALWSPAPDPDPDQPTRQDVEDMLSILRAEREVLMGRALFLDDKLNARIRGDGAAPLRRLTGRIWGHFLSGTERSPVLEAAMAAAR